MPTADSLSRYLGGGGATVLTVVASPAAGLNWEYTPSIPNGLPFLYVVRAVRFIFAASAVAGNRTIRLGLAGTQDVINDANSEVFAGQFPAVVVANSSTTFSAAPGLNGASAAGRQSISIPQTRLRQSAVGGVGGVRSSTVGIDPGDQYSGIVVLVEFFDLDADPGVV